MSVCMDYSVLTMEGLAKSDAVSGCLVQLKWLSSEHIVSVGAVTDEAG